MANPEQDTASLNDIPEEKEHEKEYLKASIEALLAATIDTLNNLEEICDGDKGENLKLLSHVIQENDMSCLLLVVQSMMADKDTITWPLATFKHIALQQFTKSLREVDTLTQRALEEYLKGKKKYFSVFRTTETMEKIANALNKSASKMSGRANLLFKVLSIPTNAEDVFTLDVGDENNNSMASISRDAAPIESEYIKEQRRLQKEEARRAYKRTTSSRIMENNSF